MVYEHTFSVVVPTSDTNSLQWNIKAVSRSIREIKVKITKGSFFISGNKKYAIPMKVMRIKAEERYREVMLRLWIENIRYAPVAIRIRLRNFST